MQMHGDILSSLCWINLGLDLLEQLPCRQIHRSEWKAAQHVKRPWKELTAETGQEQSRGPAAARGAMQPQIPLPPLRFFLLSPEEISDIYQPQYQRQAL